MHLGIHLCLATSVKTALWYLVGKFLADRPEVGTPFSRFEQTEDARYWTGQGRSPYASASVHAPPLLLAFSSPSAVLLADLCSSLLLWAIGGRLLASAGECHTLEPQAGQLLSSPYHVHVHMVVPRETPQMLQGQHGVQLLRCCTCGALWLHWRQLGALWPSSAIQQSSWGCTVPLQAAR